jgi:hypothetical protein
MHFVVFQKRQIKNYIDYCGSHIGISHEEHLLNPTSYMCVHVCVCRQAHKCMHTHIHI